MREMSISRDGPLGSAGLGHRGTQPLEAEAEEQVGDELSQLLLRMTLLLLQMPSTQEEPSRMPALRSTQTTAAREMRTTSSMSSREMLAVMMPTTTLWQESVGMTMTMAIGCRPSHLGDWLPSRPKQHGSLGQLVTLALGLARAFLIQASHY